MLYIITLKRAGLIGELKQLEVQYKGLANELRDDYNDVEENYDSLHKKLAAETYSNQDLEKYVHALDQ